MQIVRNYIKPQIIFSVAATILFIPSVVRNLQHLMIKKQMSIQIQSTTPPHLVFQRILNDNRTQKNNDWGNIEKKQGINLNSAKEKKQHWNPLTDLSSEKISLSELKFNKEDYEAYQQSNQWLNDLTPKQKQRISEANINEEMLSQNWSPPDWQQHVKETIQQEIQKQEVNLVAEKVHVYKENADGSRTTRKDIQPSNVDLGKSNQDIVNKVKGKIRLQPGLALGDRRIELRRFEDGIPKESASVDYKTGSFEIKIERNSGILLAELTDHNGAAVGSGKILLNEKTDQNDLEINITETNYQASSFYNYNKSPEILTSKKIKSTPGIKSKYYITSLQIEDDTDQSGSYRVDKVCENSASFVRAKAKNFTETLALVHSNEDRNIPLFSDNIIGSLRSIIDNSESNNGEVFDNGSTIWGQVLLDGKPQQGIQVRIINSDKKPVYMSGWIPDQSRQTSSENGYFFLLNLDKGMYTAIAEKEGVYIGHANFEADDNATTVVTIETSIKQKAVPIKVFDIFSGEPVSALVNIQSVQQDLDINGYEEITLPQVKRLSYGYVKDISEEYIQNQFTYFDDEDYIHIPVLKKENLNYYITQAKINIDAEKGIIIGAVPDDNFDIYLTHENEYNYSDRVFFDVSGNIVEKGVAGGGFILFNVPVRTQAVVVVSNKTNLMQSKIIPVDNGTVSILKFHF